MSPNKDKEISKGCSSGQMTVKP